MVEWCGYCLNLVFWCCVIFGVTCVGTLVVWFGWCGFCWWLFVCVVLLGLVVLNWLLLICVSLAGFMVCLLQGLHVFCMV